MPPPAAKPLAISNLSFKATDPLTVAYYTDGAHNYANVAICVNSTMQKGEYQVRVGEAGLLLLFLCTIRARSFDMKILCKIMKAEYHKSSACVIAWDNKVLEMQEKKVHPKYSLFWGKPQVVQLKWKCIGMPTAINKHNGRPQSQKG